MPTDLWWNVFYDTWSDYQLLSDLQPITRGNKKVQNQCVDDDCVHLPKIEFMMQLYNFWNTYHGNVKELKYDNNNIKSLMNEVIQLIKSRVGIPVIYFVLKVLYNIIKFPSNNKVRQLDVNQIRMRTNPFGQVTIKILLDCGFELLTHNNKEFLLLRPDNASKDVKTISHYGDMINEELFKIPLLDLVEGLKGFAIEDLINNYHHVILSHSINDNCCELMKQLIDKHFHEEMFQPIEKVLKKKDCAVLDETEETRRLAEDEFDHTALDYRWTMMKTELTKNWNDEIILFLDKQIVEQYDDFEELMDDMDEFSIDDNDSYLMDTLIGKYGWDSKKAQMFHHDMTNAIEKVLKKKDSPILSETEEETETETETDIEDYFDHTQRIHEANIPHPINLTSPSNEILLQYQLALADHQREIDRLQQQIQNEKEKKEIVLFECKEQLMFECPNFYESDSEDDEPTLNDQIYAEYLKHSYLDETDCEDNELSDVDDDDTICEDNDTESKLCMDDKIHIFIKQLGGSKLELVVKSNDNIQTIKDLIQDKLKHSQDEFRLIFQGKNLEDERELTTYGICNNSIIYLVFRLRGGCFIGSTKILLSTMREIDIKHVCVGDEIVSYNLQQRKIELCLVKSVIQYSVNELIEITFSDGTTIICTASHPFYVESKKCWCCVESISKESQYGNLNVGDKVINYHLKLLKVEKIVYKYINNFKTIPVYTLHIEKLHNFYANGVLVHNHMQIFVKTLDHLDAQTYTLDVEPNDTVKSIKHKIENKAGVPHRRQRLIFGKIELLDDKTVLYYNIQKEAILYLTVIPNDQKDDSNALSHINKKLTTIEIPLRAKQKFVDILFYMGSFVSFHSQKAVCQFSFDNTSYRVINFNFHSISGEILYVIMYLQGVSTWKMKDKLFTENDIANMFQNKKYQITLPRIKLTKRLQSQLDIVNMLKIQLQKCASNLISNSAWNSRKKIPIVNLQFTKKKYSLCVRLTKTEFQKRIINFTDMNDFILVPIVRCDGGCHCIEYVWIVKLDTQANIGIALRMNKFNGKITPSAIYPNIYDQHKLIGNETECKCLEGIDMCLTNVLIEDNFNDTIHGMEQENRSLKKKLNQLHTLEDKYNTNNQVIDSLHGKINKLLSKLHSIQQKYNDGLKIMNALNATKNTMQQKLNTLEEINNYYFQQTLDPNPHPIEAHSLHAKTHEYPTEYRFMPQKPI